MCCRTSRSFADLVGTDLRADHTVIDTGHHRLLIGTIIVAPANDRYPGDPVGSARPATGSLRREAVIEQTQTLIGAPPNSTPSTSPLVRVGFGSIALVGGCCMRVRSRPMIRPSQPDQRVVATRSAASITAVKADYVMKTGDKRRWRAEARVHAAQGTKRRAVG